MVGIFGDGRRCIVAGVANTHGILRAESFWSGAAGILAYEIVLVELGMSHEKGGDVAIVAGFVLDAFGGRAIAAVEVTREAGVASEVRGDCPHIVIFRRIGVSAGEPFFVFVAGGFF